MASIVGIKKSSKYLLKNVCREFRLTQVGWVEKHLNEDQRKMHEEEEKSVQSGRP
jgi:hypothetical protein